MKFWVNVPVTVRFALVPVLAVAALTGVLLLAAQSLLVGALSDEALRHTSRRAAALAGEIDTGLGAAVTDLRRLARSPLLRGEDSAAIRAELDWLRRQSPQYVWLGFVAADGRVRAASDGWLEGESIANRPVFRDARAQPFIGNMHPAVKLAPLLAASGRPVVELLDVGEPVFDTDGTLLGVLTAHLGVDWVEARRAAVDAEVPGLLLYVLAGGDPTPLRPRAPPPAGIAAAAGAQEQRAADGRHFFSAVAPLSGSGAPLGWRVLVLQDRDAALAPAHAVMRSMLAAGVVAALLFGALGYAVARRLLRPWHPIVEAVVARLAERSGGSGVVSLPQALDELERGLAARPADAPLSGPEALLARLVRDAGELKRVIDHLPVGVAISGRDFRVEFVNPSYTRLLGWTTEQVRGRLAAKFLFDPVESARFVRLYQQLGDPPGEVAARFDALTPDGRRVPIQWNLVPLFDGAGRHEGAIAVVHDLRAERAMRVRADALAGRQRALADAASDDLLATLDGRGLVLEWSRGGEAVTGHAVAEAIGRPLGELLGRPEAGTGWLQDALRDGRRVIEVECLVGGRPRFLVGAIYPLGLAPGAARFGLLLRDESERREILHHLMSSRTQLRLALDAARIASWEIDFTVDPPSTQWSEGAGEAIGVPPELLPHSPEQMYEVIVAEDRERMRAALAASLRDDALFECEYRTALPELGMRWYVSRGRAQRGEGDRAQRLIGVTMDVTERYRAEQALADSEARLAAIVASASDAVVSTDTAGRILLFNPAAERIFGHAAASMLGQPLGVLLPIGARAGHPDQLLAFAYSGVSRRAMGAGRVQGRRSDGTLIELEASISQASVAGRTVLTAILRDVTERVAQERTLEATRSELAQLTQRLLQQEKETTRRLAQALHDQIGQTLTALLLHWEGLRNTADPAAAAPLRERVEALIGTAHRQIRDVLGELRPPMLDEFGLAAALDNELRQHRPPGGVPALRLEAEPRVQSLRWPPGVEYAAFMVGREAVVNALHHAQATQVVVRLEGDVGGLQLVVEDDGGGIDPALATHRPGHLGLVGMRERALAIGATLTLGAGSGRGTIVTLSWELGDEPDLPDR